MSLKENMENRARPVILHEMIPPNVSAVEELEKKLDSIRGLAGKVDGINIPEIHEETRRRARQARLPERMQPRVFAQAIQKSMEMESVINRVTVHEPLAAQHSWMKETASDYVIRNLILVGGESHKTQDPGPSVTQATKILTDIFDNLPSHPPALGINVEQITSRNFKLSLRMLAKLTGYYQRLLRAHYSPSGKSWQTASLPHPLAERSTIQ